MSSAIFKEMKFYYQCQGTHVFPQSDKSSRHHWPLSLKFSFQIILRTPGPVASSPNPWQIYDDDDDDDVDSDDDTYGSKIVAIFHELQINF
jgi:hypothetical protein